MMRPTSMLRLTLAAIAPVVLLVPAKADKFHFGTKDEADKTEGNGGARAIEGVLVKQDDSTYTIRVVGGEITVAKSSVSRIEKDGLTVASIEQSEKQSVTAVAAAETKRRQVQAAEATASRQARVAAAKQSEPKPPKTLVIEVDFKNLLPGYTFRAYDPVLHRANLTNLRSVVEKFLRKEVREAAHRDARRRDN